MSAYMPECLYARAGEYNATFQDLTLYGWQFQGSGIFAVDPFTVSLSFARSLP